MYNQPNQSNQVVNQVVLDEHKFSSRSETGVKKVSNLDPESYVNLGRIFSLFLKRGFIDIRRFFNDDNFVIRATIFIPEFIYKEVYKGMTWTINNKIVDPAIISRSLVGGLYYNKFATQSYNGFFGYSDVLDFSDQVDAKGERRFFTKSYVLSCTLTSQQLGLKFNDFQNLTISFANKSSFSDPDFWQIKKEHLSRNSYIVNAKDNKVIISVPEYYRYEFDEWGNIYDTFQGNFDFNLNFTPISQVNKVSKLISIKAKSFDYNQFSIKDYNQALHYLEVPPKEISETYYKLVKTDHNFLKNQSLSNYGVTSFSNKVTPNIDTRLHTNLIKSVYESGEEEKEIFYNNYVEYNYKTGQLENTPEANQKGLIVPYNYKGLYATQFKFFFDGEGKNNINNFTNILVNNTQNIENQLLDPYSGIYKLNLKEEIPENDDEYEYLFTKEQIEWFIKNDSYHPSKMFEDYKIND
ncbi:MHO_1580 family protein [Mycoplasmopsis adleri]|uniref:MHO_1580 family protein n=1 Tax=Mycoplasmopsis adleri TaxID=51362 RepID=UPI003873701D